jgi:hypothetical protein
MLCGCIYMASAKGEKLVERGDEAETYTSRERPSHSGTSVL